MKKLLLSLTLIMYYSVSFSQDQEADTIQSVSIAKDAIILNNGEEIECIVSEMNPKEIKYKKELAETVYVINREDVFMVKHRDGSKDLVSIKGNTGDLYKKGVEDAEAYYPSKKTGAGGTLILTLLGGAIVGLVPALACSSAQPKIKNLNLPNKNIVNYDYIKAYTETAHKKKKSKVWRHYGIGVGINILTALAATILLLSLQ